MKLKKFSNTGFSLIELTFSLFLIGLTITIILQYLLNNKIQAKKLSEFIQKELDSQISFDLIRENIKSAGFTPCLNLDLLTSWDYRIKSNLRSSIEIKDKPTTLITRKMSEHFFTIEKILAPNKILIAKTYYMSPKLTKDSLIIIADCYKAELATILQVINLNDKKLLILGSPLYFNYTLKAYLGKFFEEKFFIKLKQNKNSLFYQENHSDELTTNITNMQIKKLSQENIYKITFKLANAKNKELYVKPRA